MYDLICGPKEVEEIILQKYPQAKITDASDYIHTERFELEISDIEDDEFYPFAIANGFAEECFSFSLLLESLRFPKTKRELTHNETKDPNIQVDRLSKGNGTSIMKTMGHFDLPLDKTKKPKFCKHCGKPVRDTIGNLRFCKECIKIARKHT